MNRINPSPVPFHDFILEAQQMGPEDALVVVDGRELRRYRMSSVEDTGLLHEQLGLTREIFEKSVEQVCSLKQIKHTLARYNHELSEEVWAVGSAAPIEPRDVALFGTSIAAPYTYNLKEIYPKKHWTFPGTKVKLSALSDAEIDTLYQETQKPGVKYLGKGPVPPPQLVSGGPQEAHGYLGQSFLSSDKQFCYLMEGIEHLTSSDPKIPFNHPYYSRLNMAIVSHLNTNAIMDDEKRIIKAPLGNGKVGFYKIYKTIACNGLVAFALVPVSKKSLLPPLLVFRCTQQALGRYDAVESLLNDTEERIGESGYLAAKEQLTELMNDSKFCKNKKINVLAYSLGGGHATYFMRDFWRKVENFVGFNFVGSPADVVDALAKEINELSPESIPPQFYIHRNVTIPDGSSGDWVNHSGDRHIGYGIKHPNCLVKLYEWYIYGITPPTREVYQPLQIKNWMILHAIRPMDRDIDILEKYQYRFYEGPTQCDPLLNTFRDRELETLRRSMGKKLAAIVLALVNIADFFFRVLLGTSYFKRNISPTVSVEMKA